MTITAGLIFTDADTVEQKAAENGKPVERDTRTDQIFVTVGKVTWYANLPAVDRA